MLGREPEVAPDAAGQGLFATTHWSVVLAARQGDSPQAREALERLCRTYWYPLYAYIRHRGHSPEDSQDLTQEFFRRLLEKDYLSQVDPRKGKFRSFLLASVTHFLANEWDRARTVKRGGRTSFVPFDEVVAEQRYATEQAACRSPEQIYEKAWGLALLGLVLGRLREEAVQANRGSHFDELKVFLTGEKPAVSYLRLAIKLGTNEPALRKEVQRLRVRYGELLLQEISRTVANPGEAEEELCHLFKVLGS